jgi:hypothetical protein
MSADPDLYAGDSFANMAESLAGPLRGGAVETVLPIPASGIVDVSWATREPLLLLAPRAALPTGATVQVALGGKPDPVFAGAVFERFSEAGASIPIHRPAVDATTRMAVPFSLALAGTWRNDDGSPGAPIAGATLATLFEIHVIEGVLGRLLYAVAAEKMRIRRCGAENAAMRRIATARLAGLDRIGADLGVPRFSDALRYDATTKEILASFDASGLPIVESDPDYRARLSLYRRFRTPSRTEISSLLNGPGAATDPNAGPLSELGFAARFTLDEDDDPFAMTLQLVEVGNTGYRANFLAYLRTAFLVWLEDSPAADLAHACRFIASAVRTATDALRARLRAAYAFPAGAAVAPVLAQTLDRLAAVYAALGGAGKLTIARAQDATAGSRYELGLGLDLTPLTPAVLDALAATASAPHRAPAADPDVEATIASLVPLSSAKDPDGAWLFSGCDFATVFRVDPNTLYLSHLPIDGLVISGPSTVAAGAATTFTTAYEAPGSPNENAALATALAAAAAAWTSAGHAPWTVLDAATALNDWKNAPNRAAADAGLGILRGAGLPALQTPGSVATQLAALPGAMLTTVRLDPALASAVNGGQTAAIAQLQALWAILSGAGFTSALPMFDAAGELLVVLSVIGLPFAGLNLNERRASGFLWYLLPIDGDIGAQFGATGSNSTFHATNNGLCALVVVGFARRGKTGPYEYLVGLPAGALLNVRQYEFVMNLLASAYPAGVMINTFALRSAHVDLDGDGHADPLPPTLAGTYRDFARTRYRGQSAMGLT